MVAVICDEMTPLMDLQSSIEIDLSNITMLLGVGVEATIFQWTSGPVDQWTSRQLRERHGGNFCFMNAL